MFFKKARKKMQEDKLDRSRKALEDTLFPGEDVQRKALSHAPQGQLAHNLLAVTDKRVVVVKVDKALRAVTSSLKFSDILNVSKLEGLGKISLSIQTQAHTFPLGPFEKEEGLRVLQALEEKRLEG